MPEEERLDKLLLKQGFASSRQRATDLVKNGSVLVHSKVVRKPGQKYPENTIIEVTEGEMPWVSRGALKLEAALDHWAVDPADKICLDIGASTGGFTEILLKRGASQVIAVDTGHNQLADTLKSDPRVKNLECTDIRGLSSDQIPAIDLIVIDVSFISLELIFPSLTSFMHNKIELITLIKPQFEVGREKVGKRGIVKDPELHRFTVKKVKNIATSCRWQWQGSINSPISGGNGNAEFLAYLQADKNK